MRKRCLTVGLMMVAMAACQTTPATPITGAKTAEEAIEMFATVMEKHDAKLLAEVVDDSTEAGKSLIEMAPILMESQAIQEKLDHALIAKFGLENRAKACPIKLQEPGSKWAEMLRKAAKEKKGKWENARVEIEGETPDKKAVFEKNTNGIWHFRAHDDPSLSTKKDAERLRPLLKMANEASEYICANLEKYKTPEECAEACNTKMAELILNMVKAEAAKETAKLVVPKLDAPNVKALNPLPANALVIKVSAKKGVATFEGKELTPAQLTAAIKEAIKKDPAKNEIQLKVDFDATYGTVRPVMDAVSASGITKINLISSK